MRAELTAPFHRYGLPGLMLMDNGSPRDSSNAVHYTGFELWLLVPSVVDSAVDL